MHICSRLNTLLIKVGDKELAFVFFTGRNYETMTTVMGNKFNDSDYKSEKDEIS